MSGARQLPLVESQMPKIRADDQGEYGEVFTRRWVVDLMLDLIGYTPEADWRDDYNYYRPHSALGMLTPAEYADQWAKNNPNKLS